MDIIATGQSKTTEDRLKRICEFIKGVQKDFQQKVNTQGLKYGNLLDFINSKAKDSNSFLGEHASLVLETEFRDALRQLEEDNVISIFGNTRAPTIRFTF